MSESKGKYYSAVREKLKRVYRQSLIRDSVQLLSTLLTYFLSGVFVVILLEYLFDFSPNVRGVLFFGALLSLLSIVVLSLLPVFCCFSKFSLRHMFKTAERVGEYFAEIKDDLLNALQLLNEEEHNYSDDLIDASFKTVVSKSSSLNFTDIISYENIKEQLRRLGILLVPFIAVFLMSSGFENAVYRIWHFDQEFTQPPKIIFEVTPGSISLTKGDPLNISIKVIGDLESTVEMNIKSVDQTHFTKRRVTKVNDNEFSYTINSVTNSFQYFASSDGYHSQEYLVEVINRPFVKGLKVNVIPPHYSGMEQIFQLDNGSVTALKGSKINLEISASKRLSEAKLSFAKKEQALVVEGSKAAGIFNIINNDKYFISLLDDENITSENPVEYSINVIEDNYPIIDLRKPEDNYRITSDRIVIEFSISDDFGFSNCTLNYRLSASRYSNPAEKYEQVNMSIEKKVLEQEVVYVWNISDLFLAEGDVVSYYVEVYDNDTVSGPKAIRSEERKVKVPSLDEFFDEADEVQGHAEEELTKTMDEAEELSKELEKLSNELKKNEKEIAWEEKEKLENALNKFEKMSKKVSEVAEKMNEMQKNMAEKDLLSAETMEKYMELQDLMKQLEGSDALEAMKKMQQELQNLMRNQAQQNLDKMKMNENAFKKSLERTLNLMKRIQVDQKVDEMIKRAENLSEKLSEMNEKLKEEKQNSETMGNRSEDIKKEVDNIEKAMKELKEKMKDVPKMPLQEMNNIQSEFNSQKNQELSDQMSQQIQSSQSQQAQSSSQEMKENMDRIKEMFEAMQENMNNEMKMEMFYDFVKVINDIIYVSKEQEDLKNITEQSPNGSQQTKDLVQDQSKVGNNLNRILSRLNEMAQKSFAITPEMGKALGNAKMGMELAQTYLQNGRTANAVKKEVESMQSLNDAAIQMKSAMNQMMNGGGEGGGMSSLMQQLKQMAEQQMDINQMTQMLQQERMAQQQMAQMQRLAGEQEAIRKTLAELNREAQEAGQSQKLATDLEKILEDMKEVVENMSSNNYDDNLVQKQERILSRLLDAQRSVNDRDFEKERESNSGSLISRDGPAPLNLTDKMKNDLIREELLRAMKDGYKKDYQELIRRYFEAIEKELKN